MSKKNIEHLTEYERRALAAYYRSNEGFVDEPGTVEEVEHEGLEYVVLTNIYGPLAVYRITNQGPLRRLKRWPEAVGDR